MDFTYKFSHGVANNGNVVEMNDNHDQDGGLMQINEGNLDNERIVDSDGETGNLRVEAEVWEPANWRQNAEVGVAIAAEGYRRARRENPNGTAEEVAQQTYSDYNGGFHGRRRYRDRGPNGNPTDNRDVNYRRIYRAERRRRP